jgi:drug/metabolite transporter (DMT)-like permease
MLLDRRGAHPHSRQRGRSCDHPVAPHADRGHSAGGGAPQRSASIIAAAVWLDAGGRPGFAIDILAYHLAVVRTSVATTAVLGQLSPCVVAPFGYLLFGERQSLGSSLGLLGTFAGAVLLAGTGENSSYLGDALAALSGLSYGAYLLILRGLAGSVSPRRMILWNCLVTALLVTPLALDHGAPSLPHTVDGWLVILTMALGCQLLGHGLVVYAIARLPACSPRRHS